MFEETHRPVFSVVPPFKGMMMLQMNLEMTELFSEFIDDVHGVEPEIRALGEVLIASISSVLNQDLKEREWQQFERSFRVIPKFNGITVVQFGFEMSELLQKFISEVEEVEPEIEALQYALRDPTRSRQRRSPGRQLRRRVGMSAL